MANVICLGDMNTTGGTVTATNQFYVFIEGKPVVTHGCPVSSHPMPCPPDPCMHPATTVGNSVVFFFVNSPVVTDMSVDSCGAHKRRAPSHTIVHSV